MPVVLTVDVEYGDRPTGDPLEALSRLRRFVESAAVPVTYFVQGRFARGHPALVGELAASGATLGIHGYAHVDYRRLTKAGVRAEVADALSALAEAAPDIPIRHARVPHGYGGGDARITALLDEFGLTSVGWDLSTFDWDETIDLESRARRALAAAERGGVVLFHSWPARTPELMQRLIAAAGGEIVPLKEVTLAGSSPNGRILHEPFADPPRPPGAPGSLEHPRP